MVYYIDGLYDQIHNCDNQEIRESLHEMQVNRIHEFLHEWREFEWTYNQKGYSCKINVDYLREIQSTLLSGEIYVPRSMLDYMMDKLGIEVDFLKLGDIYRKKKWQQSVHSTGLKIIRRGRSHTEKFLLFEVYEFALTYPEYEDIFIEEVME